MLNEAERQVRHEKRTSGGQKKQQHVNQVGDSNIPNQTQPEELPSSALVPVGDSPYPEIRLTTILQSDHAYAPMASDSERLLWTFSHDEYQELWKMVTNFRRSTVQTVMKFYSKNQYLFREMMK